MSEKMHAFLLRLYPAPFQSEFGRETMLLIRDRSRHESGWFARVRLTWDLLLDLAGMHLRASSYAALSPAASAAFPRRDGVPQCWMLEGQPPRPATILVAILLSFAAFGSMFVWVGLARNYREMYAASSESAYLQMVKLKHSVKEARILGATLEVTGQPITLELIGEPLGSGRMAGAQAQTPVVPSQSPLSEPRVEDATAAVVHAFDTHSIVMIGEIHANKQEYEWLCKLVNAPAFADRVDDIVVEFGNSLYQKSVDRYIAGEDIDPALAARAWRNMIGSVGPPSPVYGWLYEAVRKSNLTRRGGHQLRLVLGDPYGDWEKIKDAEDLGPFVAHRDEWYASVVKDEVLARHHRALLIMGGGHFQRRNGPGYVESQLRAAGADPYVILFGTNAAGGYDQLDPRFDSWHTPAVIALAGNWVGQLPAGPVLTGGMAPASPLKLADAADALLYLGQRDALVQVNMPRAELDGTAYGEEIARRLAIQRGRAVDFLPAQDEVPQFQRPQPRPQGATPPSMPSMPPMPKSVHDPLPPRPPSQ